MAKKIQNIATEGKTLEGIMTELKAAVDKHNEVENAIERVKAAAEVSKLVADYNDLSLFNSYSECLENDQPVLTLIKKYQYPTVSVSTKKDTGALAVNDEGSKVFNLWNFVDWCEARNKQVTVALNWKSKAEEARELLLAECEKYIETGAEFNVSAVKSALQAMFDSIVMVLGEAGNNAVIAKSKNVRTLKLTCSKLDKTGLKAQIGGTKVWQSRAFAFLKCAVEGNDFEITYGDPEEVKPQTEAEAETEETAAE